MQGWNKTGPGQDMTNGEMIPAAQVDKGNMASGAIKSYCACNQSYHHL